MLHVSTVHDSHLQVMLLQGKSRSFSPLMCMQGLRCQLFVYTDYLQ
jgi:hypothetical protein